ncbi:mitochondrial carrier domain-containing protein [Xylaria grammica]|nr:mitochondrial carrier domain-containing protein [Xylaria grammica]
MALGSPEFWAGWVSGAFGVMIGNSMDKEKVRLQAQSAPQQPRSVGPTRSGLYQPLLPSHLTPSSPLHLRGTSSSSPLSAVIKYVRAKAPLAETAAPMLGYGALNGILFWAYERTEAALNIELLPSSSPNPVFFSQDFIGSTTGSNLWTTWLAGAAAGLAIWPVSTPTELIKCRAQLASARGIHTVDHATSVPPALSPALSATPSLRSRITQTILRSQAMNILRTENVWGLYRGGGVTALRDSIGYGFYFWAYALGDHSARNSANLIVSLSLEATKVVLCGGVAGVVTWASIFPLDVIKTCVQDPAQSTTALPLDGSRPRRKGAIQFAREIYRNGGIRAFFPGLVVCSKRAFIVNAVQWPIYKGLMFWLGQGKHDRQEELNL